VNRTQFQRLFASSFKVKNKNYHTLGTVLKYNRNRNRGKFDTLNIYVIYMAAHFPDIHFYRHFNEKWQGSTRVML
jgi:hypothetical protein